MSRNVIHVEVRQEHWDRATRLLEDDPVNNIRSASCAVSQAVKDVVGSDKNVASCDRCVEIDGVMYKDGELLKALVFNFDEISDAPPMPPLPVTLTLVMKEDTNGTS